MAYMAYLRLYSQSISTIIYIELQCNKYFTGYFLYVNLTRSALSMATFAQLSAIRNKLLF